MPSNTAGPEQLELVQGAGRENTLVCENRKTRREATIGPASLIFQGLSCTQPQRVLILEKT